MTKIKKSKSMIRSKEVKKLIHMAINKALKECANQQEACGRPYEGYDQNKLNDNGLPTFSGILEPSDEMKTFSATKPTQVKMTIEFYFGEETHQNKHGKLVCAPVVDLSKI